MFSFGRRLFASCAIFGAFWGKSIVFCVKIKVLLYYFVHHLLSRQLDVARGSVFKGKIGVDGYCLQKRQVAAEGENVSCTSLCELNSHGPVGKKPFASKGEKRPPFPALSRKLEGGAAVRVLLFLSR